MMWTNHTFNAPEHDWHSAHHLHVNAISVHILHPRFNIPAVGLDLAEKVSILKLDEGTV
jgi:hypothetical protein